MNEIGVPYLRYSSDNQREESIEGQLRDCIAYAEREGITLLDPYIDRALSAKTDNRPSFQRMIADSEKGLFSVVIVWKLDRFSRDRYDSAHYKRILKKNGVRVISATESISSDPSGILMESVLEGMAEYYSAELAEKVIRGLTDNKLKGKSNGGPRPFGLLVDENKNFYPDPVSGPIVYQCFRMYDDGFSVQDTVDYLVSAGVRTPMGNEPGINFVTRMLRNRKYAGDYVYDGHIIDDAFPAIVPRDMFNRIQARMDTNARTSARFAAPERYLLTTKLFCGECGSSMSGDCGTSRTGAVYNYYKCAANKRKKSCNMKAVKKDFIERIVVEYTKRLIMDDTTINCLTDIILELQEKGDDKAPYYKKQLDEVQRSIDNIMKAIEQGIITPTTKERLDELEERKSQINVSIIEAELTSKRLSKEDVERWLKQFRSVDTDKEEQCQLLIDSFVNSVYVYDDRLLMTFNVREGTHTVTFEEANSLFSSLRGSDMNTYAPPTGNR